MKPRRLSFKDQKSSALTTRVHHPFTTSHVLITKTVSHCFDGTYYEAYDENDKQTLQILAMMGRWMCYVILAAASAGVCKGFIYEYRK